ncbi:MAG: diiron oxygenase [Nocardioides sp.]|uniref:AurF N-oxygenase family protein n=1 Tax=Nocardioides sp. TaxID=35761 RepID=UPI0039E40B59
MSAYHDTLRTLSEASVHQHFDAFADIDWDDPALQVDPTDARWALGPEDNLGAHPWYRSLPLERQVEIGLYRWALLTKVGLQFEQILIAGIMFGNLDRRNRRPEFRYTTHEATEETHHTQMFQELVNRTGLDVQGGPPWFRRWAPFIASAARWAPPGFWMGVLAGEEPIDHLQKSLLRSGRELHPLLERIMAIHVAEEARHIGFAHQYLVHQIPRMGPANRALLAVATPLIMRLLGDVIMRPSPGDLEAMGIPDEVAREVWWDSEESRRFLRDLYADVRMLFDELGLRGRAARAVWRLMRIEGRSSRYRGAVAAASAAA